MRIAAEATRAYVRDNRATVLGQASVNTSSLDHGCDAPDFRLSSRRFPADQRLRSDAVRTGCRAYGRNAQHARCRRRRSGAGQRLARTPSSMMGAGGGGRFSTNPTTIQGAGGGWSMPITSLNNRANNAGRQCNGTTAGRVQIAIGTPVYAVDGCERHGGSRLSVARRRPRKSRRQYDANEHRHGRQPDHEPRQLCCRRGLSGRNG